MNNNAKLVINLMFYVYFVVCVSSVFAGLFDSLNKGVLELKFVNEYDF